MRNSISFRAVAGRDHLVPFKVAELSFRDLWRILLGREVKCFGIIIRSETAYAAFNLQAGTAVEAAGPASHAND